MNQKLPKLRFLFPHGLHSTVASSIESCKTPSAFAEKPHQIKDIHEKRVRHFLPPIGKLLPVNYSAETTEDEQQSHSIISVSEKSFPIPSVSQQLSRGWMTDFTCVSRRNEPGELKELLRSEQQRTFQSNLLTSVSLEKFCPQETETDQQRGLKLNESSAIWLL